MAKYARTARMTTVVVALILTPWPVHAGGPVGGFATEVTQIANHVELVNQLLQQTHMAATVLSQFQDMQVQGLTIQQQQFGPIMAQLQQLGGAVQGGLALAYSMQNLDAQFQQRFPGYQRSGNSYSQQYQTWSNTVLATTLGTLRAIGLHGQQLQTEQAIINALRQMSQSAQGRDQMIEVGNQVSEQQVEQLQKLRQLMLVDLESKATYQAYALQQQANGQGDADAFFAPVQQKSDGVPF